MEDLLERFSHRDEIIEGTGLGIEAD